MERTANIFKFKKPTEHLLYLSKKKLGPKMALTFLDFTFILLKVVSSLGGRTSFLRSKDCFFFV